ncbi:SMP-30/gluconolactonase/LRE family protein [Shewanella sp. D64]|uniref:SMP-30/gluconolactonase/LRE family protein n=1 Tax=unclassified Shewanella TaxID=196818 RepID=UPI0022BA4CB7|nr:MULTISPECIES: SMP-30/gluconolactonase/LRE family protein [unclassified Shewanella]MEC4724568.1 SMP-30/gluconolactonase/LRE family protein [Shewanella sp. D64]MEC4736655.1 SMP-30/gluconolactonase/LRE family protein [Shewanella sp. E94]WBJ98275.1 SMP-30/gluconolactonase/LRE family protein [Shewanella sp. MTB7]
MQPGGNNNNVKATFLYSVPVANTLGEGVLWDDLSQKVWWTDIEECVLYAFEPQQQTLEQWQMPERLCSFALTEKEGLILGAFASGFALFCLHNNQLKWIARPELTLSGNRLNDGRVDAAGRFWCGSMVETDEARPNSGSLYCISKGICDCREQGFQIFNGLSWSPDNRWLYCADSDRNVIYRHAFDHNTGQIGIAEVLATTPKQIHPDGSIMDSEGGLWNAQWGGSRVVRYDTAGEIQFVLNLPVTQPSCVAFGGEAMDLLFITSANLGLNQQQLAQQPTAGALLVYQIHGKQGLPTPRYRL